MSLNKKQKENIENILKQSLRNKFENHNPEPSIMPFHTRLLGKDRLELYSFIHSLNTNFGTTMFEPVALELSKNRFSFADKQQIAGDKITSEAQKEIQKIMNELTTAQSEPDKLKEIERIRKVSQKGEVIKVKPTKVDLLFKNNNEYFLFDIKTAKPNAGSFKEFKRTLLEWVAVILYKDKNAIVNSIIAIPYNPYHPDPYNRWTMRGMIDLEKELKVAEEFWDFLGGKNTYNDLLDCFEKVGIEMRVEIDKYFKRFK